MVKIKNYKISKAGRGLKITLPAVWLDDLGLSKGDILAVYRDTADRLIIVPPGKPFELIDGTAGQAKELAAALGRGAT